jgi:hypothetical protein
MEFDRAVELSTGRAGRAVLAGRDFFLESTICISHFNGAITDL